MDVIIFTQTYMTEMGASGPCLDAAMDAYRAAAPLGALQNVRKLALWIWLLVPLTAPVRWLRPMAKEFKAIPLTLAYLRGLPA